MDSQTKIFLQSWPSYLMATPCFPGGTSYKESIANAGDIDMQFQSLGWEDPLEEGTATHSSILDWRIPRTEEPGGLQSMGSQRVGHDRSNLACTHATLPATQAKNVDAIFDFSFSHRLHLIHEPMLIVFHSKYIQNPISSPIALVPATLYVGCCCC